MEDQLKFVFQNVNEWLKHAETKCATLLAANGLAIFGLVRLGVAWQEMPTSAFVYGLIAVTLLLASMVSLMVSFSPSLQMPWLFKKNSPDATDNLIFFSHIAKYTPKRYCESLSKSLNKTEDKITDFEIQLANQIIANSVIADRKYAFFRFSIWITISAIISPLGAWLVWRSAH